MADEVVLSQTSINQLVDALKSVGNNAPHNNTTPGNSRNTNFNTKEIKETYMVDGMPTRTSKSYGYRDTESFKFDFIDPNFQNADNSVEPWARGGEGTRIFNKSKAKNCEKIIIPKLQS